MRLLIVSVVLVGLLAASGAAQGFEDVPPWHWSRAAIDRLATGRIVVGFPPNDRDLAINAVNQVYESFAHASHPQSRAWAERFLTNLPANWPQPLRRSRLHSYLLTNMHIRFSGRRVVVSYLAVIRITEGSGEPTPGPMLRRGPLTVEVLKDTEGRWRVNYASLPSVQADVFR
jgi:hypothetical protein